MPPKMSFSIICVIWKKCGVFIALRHCFPSMHMSYQLDQICHRYPKDLGIFDLIQLSWVGPKYNSHMLIATMCFWDTSTNTFHLPCVMITLTLFDVVIVIGLLPIEEPFEPSTKAKPQHGFSFHHNYLHHVHRRSSCFKKSCGCPWTHRFPGLLGFSVCFMFSIFLGGYIFYPLGHQPREERKNCLSKLVLYGIYESMGLASQDLNKRANPEGLQVGGSI